LVKTFALRELVARLQALMRRGAADRPMLLMCGDLTLEPISRMVTGPVPSCS
jgi:two-component system OmpR family response regulator